MDLTIRHSPLTIRRTMESPIAPAGATRWRMFTSRPPEPGPKPAALAGPDHVQGGGSFPRAVWMARTIVEAGAPVNTAAIAVSSSSMRPSKSYALRATIEIKVIR